MKLRDYADSFGEAVELYTADMDELGLIRSWGTAWLLADDLNVDYIVPDKVLDFEVIRTFTTENGHDAFVLDMV